MACRLSVVLNLLLIATLMYLLMLPRRGVVEITSSSGEVVRIDSARVQRQLAEQYGEDTVGDLIGRELIAMASRESNLELDEEELEGRWQLLSSQPETKADLDSGEVTEAQLRSRLETMVLLDQLTLYDLTSDERDEALRSFYEKHRSDLERVKLRHILLDSKKDAEEVLQRLGAGVEFGSLAKRFSLDPLSQDIGGSLGWKSRGDLVEDLASLVFILPVGRVSSPVATSHGWHLFYVEERQSDYVELLPAVRRRWCESKRVGTLQQLKERFKVDSLKGQELIRVLR